MPAIPLATFSPNFTSQSTAAHNHRPSSFLPLFLPCSVFYLHSFLLAPGQVYVVNFRGKFPILAFPKLLALCYCLDSVAQNPKELTWQRQTSLGAQSTGLEVLTLPIRLFSVLRNSQLQTGKLYRTNDLVSSTNKLWEVWGDRKTKIKGELIDGERLKKHINQS